MDRYCSKCKRTLPIAQFHKQPQGKGGLFCWCKECANAYQRSRRHRLPDPEKRRENNLWTRYRLRKDEADALLARQGGVCAICKTAPKRPCVDHEHATGRIRGILCDRCNLAIHILDRPELLTAAMRHCGITP